MQTTRKQFRKRNAILACLRQSMEHPSAEELYELLQREQSDISRASVYRNLTLFKNEGCIVSLGTVNGVERFDGRMDPHVHFTCTCCGAVSDVPDLEIPGRLTDEVAKMLECRVDGSRVMLTGICKKCLEKNQ